jgi:hypothetical protein
MLMHGGLLQSIYLKLNEEQQRQGLSCSAELPGAIDGVGFEDLNSAGAGAGASGSYTITVTMGTVS